MVLGWFCASRGLEQADTADREGVERRGRVQQPGVLLEQIVGVLPTGILGELVELQVARRHHEQHAQLARKTIQGIGQPADMPTVVHLIQVAIAEIEHLATVLPVQVAHGFLDRLLDKLGLILSVVFEYFAGEQAELRDELALWMRYGHANASSPTKCHATARHHSADEAQIT